MQTKNLKVAYTSRQTKHSYISVPKIQMEGKWLEELGFSIGTFLKVEFEEGSIRIRPLTAEELAEREQQKLQADFNRKYAELEQAQADLAASYSNHSSEFAKVAESSYPTLLILFSQFCGKIAERILSFRKFSQLYHPTYSSVTNTTISSTNMSHKRMK